ncbi:MAG: hypothetical protein J6J35_01845 [Alphaproteobacteria bacterium]|nr:hypothetical protein [Alphaproteobacteria bacterium]
MEKEDEILNLRKYILITNILEKSNYKKLFSNYDTLLIKKRFDNAYELSSTENILRIDVIDLKGSDINKIIDNFYKAVENKSCFEKRNIYEIIKISNLPALKLNKYISKETYLTIGEKLRDVSRETHFISFDFLILRALDNFIAKTNQFLVKKEFIQIKNDMIKKLIIHQYTPETKEKESNYFCWIDRILSALQNKEITISDYIVLNKKILSLISNSIDTYWKIFYSTNVLLLQQEFSANQILRDLKKSIFKTIIENYKKLKISQDDILTLTIRTLAKNQYTKEDFYYLFDCMQIFSSFSETNKSFCLDLCIYILYINNKQNFMSHRFVRYRFMDFLTVLVRDLDSLEIKQKELHILINMFHTDLFFLLEKKHIFESIIKILKTINNGEEKLTHNNFYRYCDILDYMIANNNDIVCPNVINELCLQKEDRQKILKKFKLSLNLKKVV